MTLVRSTDLDAHPLIRKLESILTLSEDEKAAIRDLPMEEVDVKADMDIVRVGDSPSRSWVVCEGVTCSYVPTVGGKRQIVAFGVVGDMPDLQSLLLDVLDNSIATLTPCRVGFLKHTALRDLCQSVPRVGAALWRSTLIEGAIFRGWMTSIGQRDAYGRMAHLFCEMVVRNRAVGLAQGSTCGFPVTQAELGDALGMTPVHVNRVLRALRTDGLIVLESGVLTVLDWDRLVKEAEFEPTYLHLRARAAA